MQNFFQKDDDAEKIVHVVALDYDGCLGNISFKSGDSKTFMAKVHVCGVDKSCNFSQKNLLELAHDPLWEHLEKDLVGAEVKLLSGSARQSWLLEWANIRRNWNGSSFLGMVAVQDLLREWYPGRSIILDSYLLSSDFCENNPVNAEGSEIHFGDSDNVLKVLSSSEQNIRQLSGCVFDKSKLLMLYAHLHRQALAYPDRKIIYSLYDDVKDLLDDLGGFLRTDIGMKLIPNNITVRLYQYGDAWDDVGQYFCCGPRLCGEEIIGKGVCYSNYADHVLQLSEALADYGDIDCSVCDFRWSDVEGSLLECIKNKMDNFIRWVGARDLKVGSDEELSSVTCYC